MDIGKLPNDILEKIVFNNITNKRDEVLVRPGVGEDCGVLDFGEYACVLSTDPITGASENIGKLAVHISCNDVASNGAEPIAILMTIMAPKSTTEKELEKIMRDAGEASKEVNIEIIGGHTEITDAVNRVVISTTVIGKQLKNNVLNSKNVEIGDKILMTKSAGIEGTSIMANEISDKLEKILSKEELEEAKGYIRDVSVIKEGKICGNIGVNYMHDITEGGLLGALWEASKATDKGVYIYGDDVPISDITIKICKALEIDPLKLISSGSMIIISKEDNVKNILEELSNNNINVKVIGEIIEDGMLIEFGGKTLDILPPESDELYKVI